MSNYNMTLWFIREQCWIANTHREIVTFVDCGVCDPLILFNNISRLEKLQIST